MSMDPALVLRAISRLSARERCLIAARTESKSDPHCGEGTVTVLLRVFCALRAAGSSGALIGGVAVGLHAGFPRATLGIDLAVPSAHRAPVLTDRLVAAGFELRGEYTHSVNFRHANGEPVQLAFDEAFDAMIERAEEFEIEGSRIRVVAKDDLIEMKRRAAADPSRRRSKALRDQADVELLLGDVPDPDEGW